MIVGWLICSAFLLGVSFIAYDEFSFNTSDPSGAREAVVYWTIAVVLIASGPIGVLIGIAGAILFLVGLALFESIPSIVRTIRTAFKTK